MAVNLGSFAKVSTSAGLNRELPVLNLESDADPEKVKRDLSIDLKRKGQFLIDSEFLQKLQGTRSWQYEVRG